MGFVTINRQRIHASQLPVLNPPGSIKAMIFNEETQQWEEIKLQDLLGDIGDLVSRNFWDLV